MRPQICIFFILISTVTLPISYAYNILIFAFGVSNSHVLFDARLADILAGENGENNVTLLIEEYNPDTKKAKLSKFVEEIRYSMIDAETFEKKILSSGNEVYEDRGTNLTQLSQFIEMARNGCEAIIQDRLFLEKLRRRRYDVAIAHMASLCPMGVIKLLEIPTYVWYSSGLLIDYLAANIGGTSPPSFVPQLMSSYTDRMTFWQRCRNFGGAALLAYFYHFRMVGPYNELFRRYYGVRFPDLYRLASKSSLLLVNNEELLDFPRPILHKILYIGGIGLNKPQKLDRHWLNILEGGAYRGVVVFSLGSIANTTLMPNAWKKIFVETFGKFPDYKFIWKFDGDLSMFKIPENVIISKWLPQVDLFGHPKVKAFITHAGFNSILEACTYGVPLVTIPLFADQFSNFKRVERRGVALAVQKTELSVEKLSDALEKILKNESYSQNAKRLSNLIRKKPGKNSELVRQWIEYVAENGGLENLEPASIDLNFAQYFSLDVLAVVFFFLFFSFFIVISIFRSLYRRFLAKFFVHKKSD